MEIHEMKVMAVGLLLAVFLCIPADLVMGAELRCGSKLVSVGDHKYDVLRKCGDPAHIEVWEEVRARRDLFTSVPVTPEIEIIRRSPFVQELVTVEEWEYDLGQTRFIRYLIFENGRLKKITAGDYGN